MFVNETTGALVEIAGTDPRLGDWRHKAFVPNRLPGEMPDLSMPTVLAVANARAALAALDSTARRLPDPTLLRVPTLRREAHSTSALEGTYAPLAEVLGPMWRSPARRILLRKCASCPPQMPARPWRMPHRYR